MPRPASVQEASTFDRAWLAAERGPTPHHLGHRERLRTRAAAAPGALPDYELLELLLFRSLPQGDVKPLAKALLDRFGGLAGVLSARPEELRTVQGRRPLGGAGPEAAARGDLAHRPRRGGGPAGDHVVERALGLHPRPALAHEAREQFRVLFLDKKNQLIADETHERGHRRSRPGLSARGDAPGAGAVGERGDPGAQPPLGRSHPLAPPTST